MLVLAVYLILYATAGLHPTPALSLDMNPGGEGVRTPLRAADLTSEQMWAFDAATGQVGASWTGEFLPRWVTEQRWAIGREPSDGRSVAAEWEQVAALGPLVVQVLGQGYLHERLAYRAAEPTKLVFPLFYFPAWRVAVDGRPVAVEPVGSLGLLAASLPAGEHIVTRHWAATPAVWAGRAVSGLAWLAVLALLVWRRDRRLWPAVVGWLLVTAVAAAGASGLFARERPANVVGAAYDFVRLEAAVVSPAQAGKIAPVTLTWLVVGRPEPITAFVHVLAADGRVVAQHDGPLGGRYTTAGRWLPAALLRDEHPIPLPADLAPGVYTLAAGLYRPGAPQAPLRSSLSSPADPRVTIGRLEVRP